MSNMEILIPAGQIWDLPTFKVDPYKIDRADIVIGIPSYNEADNIAFVVEQCNRGVTKYFPNHKSVIINVDNNSPDDTRNAFLNSVNHVPKVYISTPPGVKGKGNNFHNLFMEAVRLRARLVVVVDADLCSITPEWIRDLATPIIRDNYDYATPLYSRNEYDSTITNNICYPLMYGLLGKDIRQPIGGDFAFSGRLAHYYLQQPWHDTTFQYGIDIFMTMNAIMGGFKLCQVALGAKVHKPSAPKLGPMFTQVVDTLFRTLLTSRSEWSRVATVEKLALHGKEQLAKPQALSVDYKSLKATAIEEFLKNKASLVNYLPASIYRKVLPMYESGILNITIDLWTKIVYELLYAYDQTNGNHNLIQAMKSLYFGRVVSFIRQTLDLDYESSEVQIQKQAQHFFKMRNYFIQKFSS